MGTPADALRRRLALPGALATPALLVAALLLTVVPAAAQEEPEDGERFFNFAFASQLGSGIYSVDGRTVQVYRVPVSWRLRPAGEGRLGWRLRLPVTFGFYDFKPGDLVDTGLPESLATLTVVPGIEMEVPLGDRWQLFPRAEAGVGRDFSDRDPVWIFAAGLGARSVFPLRTSRLHLGGDLLWAGQASPGEDPIDRFVSFEAGADLRRPLRPGAGEGGFDYGLYLKSYLYLDGLEFLVADREPFEVRAQWEIGVTFGSERPPKLWRIPLPRIGLGLRFGDELPAVRLVLGAPL